MSKTRIKVNDLPVDLLEAGRNRYGEETRYARYTLRGGAWHG